MLELVETTEVLLTHQLVPCGPIPTAYDRDGLYPYESFCETSRRPILKKYRMVSIENDQIRIKICPDLGGRVCSLFLKKGEVETLFFPHVIRPVRILPRQSFTGGGIELSFPISHSPVETAPVLHDVMRDQERIYVCCGERELRYGMHWTVEYSLGERDSFLTQRTIFFNPDSELILGCLGRMPVCPPDLILSFIFRRALSLSMLARCGISTGKQKVHGSSRTCVA